MNRKDWIFYFLCVFGMITAFGVLIYEILYGGSWFILPLEMGIVGIVCIMVNVGWNTTLAKILSGCLFLGALMIGLIESQTMQHLFTTDFLLGELLILINLVVIVALAMWITRPKSILDFEIIEITPIK